MTNASDWLPTLREGGYVLDPLGPRPRRTGRARGRRHVAAVTLTEDGREGAEYLLTGSEAFTVAEQVQTLAKAIARDIEVRTVDTPARRSASATPAGHRRRSPTHSSMDSLRCALTQPEYAATPCVACRDAIHSRSRTGARATPGRSPGQPPPEPIRM